MEQNQCPHCQSDKGYFIKTQIRGASSFNYKFDGSYDQQNNSHVHDSLTYKEGKYAYCRSCDKRLFKVN